MNRLKNTTIHNGQNVIFEDICSTPSLEKTGTYFIFLVRRKKDNIQRGVLFNNIGGIYYKLGEPDNALEYMKKALTIFQKTGNTGLIVAAFNTIGKIYHQKGDLEQALVHFQLGIQLKDSVPSLLSKSRLSGLYPAASTL